MFIPVYISGDMYCFGGGEKSGFGIDVKVVIGVTVEGTIGSVTRRYTFLSFEE